MTADYADARGAIVYGSHFYPLLALGVEQLTRVMDTAVEKKCRQHGCVRANYHQNVEALRINGLITGEEEAAWIAGKDLRNIASYRSGQMIVDPEEALRLLSTFTERINRLFPAQEN